MFHYITNWECRENAGLRFAPQEQAMRWAFVYKWFIKEGLLKKPGKGWRRRTGKGKKPSKRSISPGAPSLVFQNESLQGLALSTEAHRSQYSGTRISVRGLTGAGGCTAILARFLYVDSTQYDLPYDPSPFGLWWGWGAEAEVKI